LQKKLVWEQDLENRKEQLATEKKELEELRKLATDFESEKEKAIKQTITELQKTLQEKFDIEKKLREQEFKAEKELLALRITNQTQEISRQSQEITALKKSLEETTKELKDVAIRVIDASKPTPPAPQANSPIEK